MKISGKVLAVAGVVLLAVSALGAVRFASAQEGSPPPADGDRAELRQLYVETFASNLGVSVDELQSASRDAAVATVDAAVERGLLTEEQGARLKERIESSDGFGLAPFLRLRHRAHDRHEAVLRGIAMTAAETIGIEPAELRDELQSGKSIAQVAQEHGVSVDEVRTAVLDAAEARLSEAVANGRLTQEQADDALSRLEEHIDDILNGVRPPAEEPPAP